MLFRGSILRLSALSTLATALSVSSARADNIDEWTVSKVMEKIQSSDRDWAERVFKGLYISEGKLASDNGSPGNTSDDFQVGQVFVKTIINSTGKTVYDLDNLSPAPVVRINLRDIATFDDGGILQYDPATGTLYYKPANDLNFYVVDSDLMSRYPGLRDQLGRIGFTFDNGSDGSLILIDGGNRLGRGPSHRIVIGGGGLADPRDRGGDRIVIRDGGGARDRIGDIDSRGNRGYRSDRINARDGGIIELYNSDADIVDSSKFVNASRQEWEIGGAKYRYQRVNIPGWFNDEKVIVRQGPGGDWYLIDEEEYNFIMRRLKDDPKYKDVYAYLSDSRVSKWHAEDYAQVRKYSMKYPNARGGRGYSRVRDYGTAGRDGGNSRDSIRVRDGDSSNVGDSEIDLFIQDYKARYPRTSLRSLQDAVDREFGSGIYIISDESGGRYRVTGKKGDTFIIGDRSNYRPGGAQVDDQVIIRDGRRPGGGGHSFSGSFDFSGNPDLERAQNELNQAILRLSGGGSGSTTILSGGTPAHGAPGSRPASAISSLRARYIKGNGFYKIEVPYYGTSGILLHNYSEPMYEGKDYTVNPDGSITMINTRVLDGLKAKYPQVDFSSITTASGAVSGSGSKPGINVSEAPATLQAFGSLEDLTSYLAGLGKTGVKIELIAKVYRVTFADGSQQVFSVKAVDPSTPITPDDLLR